MNQSDDIFFDDWEDAMLDQLVQAEELALSSIAKPTPNPSHQPLPPPSTSFFPHQPPQPVAVSTFDDIGFSPPRELSQMVIDLDSLRPSPPRPAKSSSSNFAPAFRPPDSEKDLEIERLKMELGRATKQVANLEKECIKLKKERDKKEDQVKLVSSKNVEENACTNCLKSINKDTGILGPDSHKLSSKFQNGPSSKDMTVETTFKAKGVKTDTVSCQEAQGSISNDLPAYLDLSQKLVAVWGSPIDKKLERDAISKLLLGCQKDFHILFSFMSTSLPFEIARKLLTDISSSGIDSQHLKDCLRTPEAAKMSRLYVVWSKINDGTHVLETLIEPLLDLCGMENVAILHSSLCILHTLLKLLLEMEKNFGRSALYSGTMSSLKNSVLGRTLWILVNCKQ